MFKAIANFTLGSTAYQIGDSIAEDDYDAVQNDAHYAQFVVRTASAPPSTFPTP